jgi:hypothetical protein
MKHTHTQSTLRHYARLAKKNSLISVLFTFFSVVAISYAAYQASDATSFAPHDSELRFSERSSRASIVGSVAPASCESYPIVGDTHQIEAHGGHCANTCPSGYTINLRPLFRICQYGSSENIGVYANGLCDPVSPNTGDPLATSNTYNTPVCSAQCSDGTWAYPHLGITCPATTPTVNLQFQ